MGLNAIEWSFLLCVCAIGIQTSFSFIQNMREIEQNCFRDGGYCINTIPPPPPKQRNNNRRRQPAGARGRPGTRTRTGARPDPRAVGNSHTRLPGSSRPSRGGAAPPPAAAYPPPPAASGAPAYAAPPPSAYPPAAGARTAGQASQQNTGLFFGNSPNDPFGGMLGMMMFQRKKRQAPGVPEPHERPRRRRGQGLYPFLNQHCRKSEFDFGCRREGGMCCLPFLK